MNLPKDFELVSEGKHFVHVQAFARLISVQDFDALFDAGLLVSTSEVSSDGFLHCMCVRLESLSDRRPPGVQTCGVRPMVHEKPRNETIPGACPYCKGSGMREYAPGTVIVCAPCSGTGLQGIGMHG